MRQITIRNITNPIIQPVRAKYCASFFCHLRGWTFRRSIDPQEGLLLVQGRESKIDAAIHMLAVWTDLAVIWMDNSRKVVDVRLARAWRLVYSPAKPARYVLEIAPSRLGDFRIGDEVIFEEIIDG